MAAKASNPETGLESALGRYFRATWQPEPFSTAEHMSRCRRWDRQMHPLEGRTAGETALLELRAERRELDELEALRPGSVVDTKLREILTESDTCDGDETRAGARFAARATLLRAVQQINGLRQHRVRVCLRYMSKRGPTADGQRVVEVVAPVNRQPELNGYAAIGSPTYRGVVVCGNGWVCPVCASKITEGRRRELRAGVQAWRDRGGVAVLQTFTFSHGRRDELKPAWQQLGKAIQAFTRSSTFKRFREAAGFAGRIRSREITYGVNGWHPHSHALELYRDCSAELLEQWQLELAKEWQRVCVAMGLGEPSLEHGFDMSLTEVDDYIAKWGVDAELTKWHIKHGRPNPDNPNELGLNGYTPFDLLRIHAGELDADPRLRLSRNQAAVLFAEYAAAVKGTAQLHWTRKLKAELGVDTFTDQEHADGVAELETREVLGTLTASDWFTIVSGNHQVEFLGLVQTGGFAYARVFLDDWHDELRRWQQLCSKRQLRNLREQWTWRGGTSRRRRGPPADTVDFRPRPAQNAGAWRRD